MEIITIQHAISRFQVIHHKFPEPGHSYLDSDRDFARRRKGCKTAAEHLLCRRLPQYHGAVTAEASSDGHSHWQWNVCYQEAARPVSTIQPKCQYRGPEGTFQGYEMDQGTSIQ